MGTFAFVIFLLGLFGFAIVSMVKNLLYVCGPNEVLIFSGRRKSHGGLITHYRIVKGGRTLRAPFIEVVDRIDLTNMIIELQVKNAYSKGGIPLSIHGVANIKVPGEMPLLHNTLERFLGLPRENIQQVARETLEGNLRGVLALLTPEEVNENKEAFGQRLTEEAGHDLERLGLVLDTLNIQNVSDDVGYLDSIGRKRTAQVLRDAQMAEAQSQADAAVVKWQNYQQSEASKLYAQLEITKKQNEKRITNARTKREAVIAEQRAEVQAMVAQASAELGMQDARIEQVKLRLQADVIRPAEAARDKAVSAAKAEASVTIEQGKATAAVLTHLSRAYRSGGNSGRDVLLMQKMLPVLKLVTSTIGELKVDRLTVLGKGSGGTGNLAAGILRTTEQIKAATGIDVTEVARERLIGSAPPKRSTMPPPPPKLEP